MRRPPAPEPPERPGQCLHCHNPLRQFRLAAGVREIWMPVVCARCGEDAGVVATDRVPDPIQPELPADPEQVARDRRLRLVGIPAGFERASLADWSPRGEPTARRIRAIGDRFVEVWRDPPAGAVIVVAHGAPATGKTHFAVAVAAYLATTGATSRYASFPVVVRELRAQQAERVEPADREIAVLERLRLCDFLALDNAGFTALDGLGDCSGHLSDILDVRHAMRRPTLIVIGEAADAHHWPDVHAGATLIDFGAVPFGGAS